MSSVLNEMQDCQNLPINSFIIVFMVIAGGVDQIMLNSWSVFCLNPLHSSNISFSNSSLPPGLINVNCFNYFLRSL
jgi:hypothetical protein